MMNHFQFRSGLRVCGIACSLSLCLAAVVRADAKDDVQSAVQKLNVAKSYSWTSTVTGTMGGSGTGKTEKGGYTTVSLTMRDTTLDAVIKGDKTAIKTDDGWKTPDEMTDVQGPQRYMTMLVRNYKTPPQLVAEMLKELQGIKKNDDGAYSADLNEAAVKKLIAMNRRRQNPDSNADSGPQITNASGSVKFTLADGVLSKIELHMAGTITINGNDRDLDRTTTSTIKDVDMTTVDVPADAKAKLDAPPAAKTDSPGM